MIHDVASVECPERTPTEERERNQKLPEMKRVDTGGNFVYIAICWLISSDRWQITCS